MNFQAAIFDMDGLLLDTERLCMRVFKQSCHNVQLPFYEDIYLSIIGRNSKGIEEILRSAYGNELDKLHADWRVNYDAIVKNQPIPIKKGVIPLLEWLQANKVRTAVATSTQKDVALVKLKLAGLDCYFDNITCGCEVTQGKPNPEIYLLAAQRLGLKPQCCLAFEDSNNGVKSAVAANMVTYQIPDLVTPSEEIISLGVKIRDSLGDVLDELKKYG
ncbi:HAD family hydrolase [Vibrio caribbeanicus]|uniref:CbbY family protein n=1 Tax=Vibrio caribbeanicus ATCC BAA-2122 TaxID=796620 RepID=E3BJW2_9VIBR|nr:HAD family phosphatase [Vibrio caribbeanicus]EFP96881.1 CbbY family protein [Vibrio caribbeanicus ATCC BAA-2122]